MVPGFLYWEEFDELDEIAELVRANEKEVKEISEKMKTHIRRSELSNTMLFTKWAEN